MQSGLHPSDEAPVDYRAEAIEEAWRLSGVDGIYQSIPAWNEPITKWHYLYGEIGSGKTYRAVSMLRRYLEDHTYQPNGCPIWLTPKVKFVKAPVYLEAVKAAYTDKSDYRAEVYQSADLLVLDDLGQEAATPWACEQLFLLIDYRYVQGKITIITSQLKVMELNDRIAEISGRQQADAINSRIMSDSVFQLVGTKDRRLSDLA